MNPPTMGDWAIVGVAVAFAAIAGLLASPFWEQWFRWRNRRSNERWLRSHADYFDDMDAELEEILRG